MHLKLEKIALTKLDVLSGLDEIPVIVGYRKNGFITEQLDPFENLDFYEPVMEYLPGWKEDISACSNWAQLPDNAKSYITYIEKLLNHEIQFISVGAKRNQYLLKGEWL